MKKIGDVLYTNAQGVVSFNCPNCGIECDFSVPNSMSVQWTCQKCMQTFEWPPEFSFLEFHLLRASYLVKQS